MLCFPKRLSYSLSPNVTKTSSVQFSLSGKKKNINNTANYTLQMQFQFCRFLVRKTFYV